MHGFLREVGRGEGGGDPAHADLPGPSLEPSFDPLTEPPTDAPPDPPTDPSIDPSIEFGPDDIPPEETL